MLSEPEPLALISATHDVLAEELGHLERNIPDEMARALDENIFLFSGFKTYHEMNDASRLLKDDDGGFKPFDRFLQDVQAIDAQYNQNYLYAEYNFATASTQMAAKWADIERDGDEYDLQYRTAMDGLVRPEHAALEGITLPPSDKFWNDYYPPNGWNCRCTAVQVLKDKYPTSDSDQACAAGERATTQIGKNGQNKAAMFRFNPGKAGKVFPPKHPYYKAPAEVKKQMNVIVMTMMTVTDPREAEYRRYKDDPEYRDVERNEKGGLKAIHKDHKTHPNDDKRYFAEKLTGDQLESEFMDKAFALGHSVIFRAEAENVTDLDMYLDGKLMDLISVTKNSVHFRNQLNRKNGQLKDYNTLYNEDNNSICMYFHDPSYYSYDKVKKGLELLSGLTEVQIKTVYILRNDGTDIERHDFP